MKKVALFLFLSVCFAQQSCSSDAVETEPEENPQDILFKDDFNFFDEKVWTKETHEPGWTNQEPVSYTHLENLAYLPSVSKPEDAATSDGDPLYFVFNYDGKDVNAAKATKRCV